MMSLTFGLFTQVSCSGPLGPLVFVLMIVNISQRVSEVFSGHDLPTKMFKGT